MPKTRPVKAIVVFDTQYGNTERIAKALAKGIRESVSEVVCLDTKDVKMQELAEYDLLAIGGPTQYRSTSKSMSIFLGRLK